MFLGFLPSSVFADLFKVEFCPERDILERLPSDEEVLILDVLEVDGVEALRLFSLLFRTRFNFEPSVNLYSDKEVPSNQK